MGESQGQPGKRWGEMIGGIQMKSWLLNEKNAHFMDHDIQKQKSCSVSRVELGFVPDTQHQPGP